MKVYGAYIAIILIWSTTPLAISWSAHDVGAAFAVTSRMVLGCFVALLILKLFKISYAITKQALLAYLISGLGIYLAMGFTYLGALYLPSGWLSIIYGFSPVLTGIFASIFLDERFTIYRILGLSLAIMGLSCVFWQGLEIGEHYKLGFFYLIMAVLFQSSSAVAIKKINAKQPSLAMTAMGLVVASPLFIISWWIMEGQMPATMSLKAGLSIIYLAIMGSVFGFSLYYFLIHALEASKVALITLITPVSALFVGYWFNYETISLFVIMGTVLILLGLGLFQYR